MDAVIPTEIDETLFASLPGGQAIIDWFGFCPVFHDSSLKRLEIAGGNAILGINTFRMTSETDASGFFVLDRHALVTLHMRGVTGVRLEGDGQSIIAELLIRRLQTNAPGTDWQSCAGPLAGDVEVTFSASVGLHGSIFGKGLTFELQPLVKNLGPAAKPDANPV